MTDQNPLQTGLQQGIQQGIKATWQTVLALGVLSVLMGIVIAVWPGPTTLAIAILFGIYLLISGAFQVIAGLIGESQHRVLSVISGALSIVIGVACFRDDFITSVAILGIWIGVAWIFAGITQIVTAASDRLLPGRAWVVILGLITLIGGVVLVSSPFSVGVLVWVGGIWAVAIGITQIITALQLRSATKRLGAQQPAQYAG
ncbi:HdeD family acid-resistance protein [Tsukamurella spumae]|uniref:HdeD family acid-resistance protein n=1 Tax=Tsukamurella spumae TaxID=44753 RepID=A0A846X7J4_9ACTN|nr:HdeD family acid-resistance protein [Tsukamurella spumae]NKY20152.1 HdeD family acid-resistance protein [Tsukamurella spumae]